MAVGLLFVPDRKVTSAMAKKINIAAIAKTIFFDKKYIMISIFSMFMYGTSATFSENWGAPFIRSVYGFDNITATTCVGMHFFGVVVGGPSFAYISRVLNDYKKAMLIGAISMFIVFFSIVFVKMDVILLKFMLFLLGASASAQTLSFLLALNIAPRQVGPLVTGFVNAVTMLGGSVMMTAVGWGIDFSMRLRGAMEYSLNDYRAGVALLIISSAISIIAICVMMHSSLYEKQDVEDS
jgi:hypothetical protein